MDMDPGSLLEVLEKGRPFLNLLKATHKKGDIQVCTTRIVRKGRGFPWDRRVAIHPMEDGRLEMTEL